MPPTPSRPPLVNYLRSLTNPENRNGRAALAALRRGLGKEPGTAMETFRHVVPYLPNDIRDGDERRYYLVASLFALHPDSAWPEEELQSRRRPPNLGNSFRKLGDDYRKGQAVPTGDDKNRVSPVERRFVALLNSDREDLPTHLRQAAGLLKAKDVPIDWAVLLGDLLWWDSDSHRVQRQWASAFWGRDPSSEASLDDEERTVPEGEQNDDTDADQ